MCALRGVSFTYPGAAAPAIQSVDLTIRRGEWVALIGANGSGKSTLAKILNALLIPTRGDCFSCGYRTDREEHHWAIRSRISMVFQNPDNQIVASVVEEDVAFGPENLGVPPCRIREIVRESLCQVGLEEKRRTPTYALSGGQKQRLAIAGALAMKPECLVLDEATVMLDPQGREDVLKILRDLHSKGMTLVQITHRLEEILDATRVVVLRKGQIEWEGELPELFERVDRFPEWGLEIPPLVRLTGSLKKRKLLPESCLPSVKELLENLCP
ncbi:MAG TPA: energy-coupling factor transporter ATPase [Synergistales bacterium]|nr:energy-coupling factor transporter ATPase [Synergistales bacterium]